MKITARELYRRYLVPYVKSEQRSGYQIVDVHSAIEHARDCAFQDGYTKVPDHAGLYTNIYKPASIAVLNRLGVGRHEGALILERLRRYWEAHSAAHRHGITDEEDLYLPLATWLERRHSGAWPVPYLTLTPWKMHDGRGGAPDIVGYPVFGSSRGPLRTSVGTELVAIDAKLDADKWNEHIGTIASYRRFAHRAYLAYPLIRGVAGQAPAYFSADLQSMCRRLGIGLLAVVRPRPTSTNWHIEVVVESESLSVPPIEYNQKIMRSWQFVADNPTSYELRPDLRHLMMHMRRHVTIDSEYLLHLNTARLCCWQPAPRLGAGGEIIGAKTRMREALLHAWVTELNRFRHFFQD